MPHPSEHEPAARELRHDEAEELAETMRALGSARRLQLLLSLLAGERAVEDLATGIDLAPSATSHHLRILRSARLVRTRKDGRHVYYALHDHHIADLLAAVRHHHEHVNPATILEIEGALSQ